MLKAIVNSPVKSGDQEIVNGDLIIGTAGQGIDFSANTGAAGMTSELLDWYEEGAWTPVIEGSGTAGTYELAPETNCTYTRIGNNVTLHGFIRLASLVTGGGAGYLKISGLPFAKATNSSPAAQVYLALGAFAGIVPVVTFTSFFVSDSLYLHQAASGGYGTSVDISYASANAYIGFTLTYPV